MNSVLHESAVFTLAGVQYAFGLEWIAASRSASTVAHIRRQALRLQATHLAWRANSHQAGLARISTSGGKAPWAGWRAAAAAFADLPPPPAEPHTMIAAFAFVSGEVWVVAASQGRLLADGDRLFAAADAAKEHFRQLYERVPRWGLLFAPAEWGYARAKPDGPLSFLAGYQPANRRLKSLYPALGAFGLIGNPGVPLRKVQGNFLSRDNAVPLLVAACLAVVVTIGVAWRFSSSWRSLPASPPPPQVIAPYYPIVETVAARIDHCVDNLLADLYRRATPGWELTELTCDGASITAEMAARPFTPLSTLASFQDDSILQSSARTATSTRRFAQTRTTTDIKPPLPMADYFLAAFGRLDERVRGVNAFSSPAAPNDPAPLEMGVARPRPYRVMNWSLQTAAPPSLWQDDLSAIRSLEISEVKLKRTNAGLTWTIKGVAYVSP